MKIRGAEPFEDLKSALSELYGSELGEWLARRAASAIRPKKNTCMNNFRICDEAIPEEVELYEKQVANGCCGFCDIRLHHYKTDRRFRFGFNYGH